MTLKLNDSQLVLMSAAAQRADRCLTLPDKLKGAALVKLAAKLAEVGLVREIKAKPNMPIWRRDDEQRPFALKLTVSGLKAIAVDQDQAAGESEERSAEEDSAPQKFDPQHADAASPEGRSTSVRTGSKLALIVELLQRDGGATIDDLIVATGWLPHTARATITGLRKRGHSVARSKRDDGVSVYWIAAVASNSAIPRAQEQPGDTVSVVGPRVAKSPRRTKAKLAA